MGVKNALIAGVRTIEHGIYLDDEAIELFLKNDAFVIPILSIVNRICTKGEEHHVPAHAIKKAKAVQEVHINSMKMAKKAGVKIAAGTDFANVPMLEFGGNAMEMELLVNLVGFSPMEALVAGTKTAAEVLMMSDKVGALEKDKLADLIIVNCDPIADISCLKNNDNILLVVKDGVIKKNIS